ncbi:MAG: TRAP transporter small permease [Roseitalea sp.]|nr:TRAP transporter small permease [Roseitalea sp.]MBO6720451.1 TRAP transporter small permease [Roseitalea sp.]MBO6742811.1 TRAP transporter small permease [Roseitalea sp.]
MSILGGFAALFLLAAAIGIGADVATRQFAGTNIPWMTDVIEYGLVFSTFAAAPWLLRHGNHITIDFVILATPDRVARMLARAANLIGLIVCTILTVVGVQVTLQSAERGSNIVKAIAMPEWALLAVVPVGLALCAIEFARRLLSSDGPSAPDYEDF